MGRESLCIRNSTTGIGVCIWASTTCPAPLTTTSDSSIATTPTLFGKTSLSTTTTTGVAETSTTSSTTTTSTTPQTTAVSTTTTALPTTSTTRPSISSSTTTVPTTSTAPSTSTSTTPQTTTVSTTTTAQPTTSTTRPSTMSTRPTTTTTPTTTTVAPVTCSVVALGTTSQTLCGTCTIQSSTKGTIQSVKYPNEYGVYNLSWDEPFNCRYLIIAPPTRKIRLTFTTFTVDLNGKDYITVSDGIPPAGTFLSGNLTGYVLPATPYTTVETNQMAVVFKGNMYSRISYANKPGKWQASFEVIL
ncbi:integumentary mucin C.1-like [Daphnia pulicaria]|uniref:integumentary mucin C.1-like n=1 Tax=Daphnia pulicaria TaxID=35523 RepID=UPI001EEBA319|nr:integumentary mucin C.1-like [Daphnia pulicaria]